MALPEDMHLYVGLNFMPTDQILLEHYLFNKIHGRPYSQAVVFDCDLYGADEPWDIWNSFGGIDGKDLYFFTKLKRPTNTSGSFSAHISRKIGLADGTWSGENSATPVFASANDDQIIGYCKRFRYENRQVQEHHGEWIMHEYTLHDNLVYNSLDSTYVLCRMRKNDRPKRKATKGRFSNCQPTKKKKVVAPKTNDNIAHQPMMNQCISHVAHEPEMNPSISYMPHEFEMNQSISDILHQFEMNPSISDIPHQLEMNPSISSMPHELEMNQSIGDVPHQLEMNQSISVVPHKLQMNPSISDIPHQLEMNPSISSMPHELEMNQSIGDVPHQLEMNQSISVVSHKLQMNPSISYVPHQLEMNQGINDVPHQLETNSNISYVPHQLEMNLSISDVPYQLEMNQSIGDMPQDFETNNLNLSEIDCDELFNFDDYYGEMNTFSF